MQPLTQERIKAAGRLAASLVAAANAGLSIAGMNPLPYTDTQVGAAVSAIISVAATVWVWWKDNVITHHAATGHMVANQERRVATRGRHAIGLADTEQNVIPSHLPDPCTTMSQAEALERLESGGAA